jgi:hypothetical protein
MICIKDLSHVLIFNCAMVSINRALPRCNSYQRVDILHNGIPLCYRLLSTLCEQQLCRCPWRIPCGALKLTTRDQRAHVTENVIMDMTRILRGISSANARTRVRWELGSNSSSAPFYWSINGKKKICSNLFCLMISATQNLFAGLQKNCPGGTNRIYVGLDLGNKCKLVKNGNYLAA